VLHEFGRSCPYQHHTYFEIFHRLISPCRWKSLSGWKFLDCLSDNTKTTQCLHPENDQHMRLKMQQRLKLALDKAPPQGGSGGGITFDSDCNTWSLGVH
jgi:hypothetical protein